jgi:hypothetical protein
MKPITRRAVLRVGIPATAALVGIGSAAAEPIDGKGNDVCPCFIDVDGATLMGADTIRVTGPCGVANPPQALTVQVQVSGARGARAIGSATVDCEGTEAESDRFAVDARIRSARPFVRGDDVRVDAMVTIVPERGPAIGGERWHWEGRLG